MSPGALFVGFLSATAILTIVWAAWPRRPAVKVEPRQVDVGKAIVTICRVDGTVHLLEVTGRYLYRWTTGCARDVIETGRAAFDAWAVNCGRRGMVNIGVLPATLRATVGEEPHIPLSQIREIRVHFEPHWVEAK